MSESGVENQLQKLLGKDVTTAEPQSRLEIYLAKLNGEEVDLPEPQSRAEQLISNAITTGVAKPVDVIKRYIFSNDINGKEYMSNLFAGSTLTDEMFYELLPYMENAFETYYAFENAKGITHLTNVSFPNCTNASYMFFGSTDIKTIDNFSIGTNSNNNGYTNASQMFAYMPNLETVNDLYIGDCNVIDSLFYRCKALKEVTFRYKNNNYPDFRQDAGKMFFYCDGLVTIKNFDATYLSPNYTNGFSLFVGRFGPRYLKTFLVIPESIGVFDDINMFDLALASELDDESIESIINGLHTLSDTSVTKIIKFNSIILSKLTQEQIDRITAKGWTTN